MCLFMTGISPTRVHALFQLHFRFIFGYSPICPRKTSLPDFCTYSFHVLDVPLIQYVTFSSNVHYQTPSKAMFKYLLLTSAICLSLLSCTEAIPSNHISQLPVRNSCDSLIGLEWMSCKMGRGMFSPKVAQKLGII